MFSPFTYDPMQQASNQYYSGMTGQFMPNTGFNRPTYGQFGMDYEHMMATPYGSQFMAPSSNIYYSTMVSHPVKSFLTYKLPVFSAPKGLNPVAFDRYYAESQAQGAMSMASFGIGVAATSIGARFGASVGGPIGGIIGAGIGMAASPFLTKGYDDALAKTIQIHEASNLLNTTEGGNQFGFGLSMGQSARLYKSMTSEATKNTNFSPEEAQLTFSELARNSLIDDTGDFTQIKGSFKKMKNVVEKLRDLFNGDIKQVIHSLRQLNTAGVDSSDLATVSVTMGLAAAQMGQNTADYATNSINTAIQRSAQTGFSKSVSMQLGATLDSVTDIIGKATGNIYGNNISSKEKTRRFKDDFFNTIQATTFGPLSNILLANNMMGSGQYLATSLEAGIQEYNQANGTNYSYRDVIANKGLQKKIWEKYANPAMKRLEKEYNGDYSRIFNYLSKKDTGYMLAMTNQDILGHDLKEMSAKEITTQTFKYFSKFKNVLPEFLEKTGLERINPEMYESVKRIMGTVKNNPNIYSDIMTTSQRRAELFAEKNKFLQERRIYSGQGLWESAKAHVKDFFAGGIEMFASKKDFDGILTSGQTPSSSLSDLYKYSKGFDFNKLSNMVYNSNYINDTSFSPFRPIERMFDNKKISNSSERMKYLMGDGWIDLNYGEEDVKRIWSYQARRTRGYSRGLEQISKLEKGDLSGLKPLESLESKSYDVESMMGASLLNNDNSIGAVSDKISETTKNIVKGVKEAIEAYNKIKESFESANNDIVSKVVNSDKFIKNLAMYERKIHGFKGNDLQVLKKASEKGVLGEDASEGVYKITGLDVNKDDLSKLINSKLKIKEKAHEARLQYVVGEGGVQGLLRDMGYKGTTTYQGAKKILDVLKNNDTLREKFLSNIQDRYGVSKEAAKNVYENLMEYNKDESKKRMQVNALTFNTIGEMKFKNILKDTSVSRFYKFSGGADTIVRAMNSEGGDINKLRKDLLAQAELDKKIGGLSDDEGAGGLRTLVGKSPASANNLYSSMKSFMKENGGEIEINGHKYTKIDKLLENKEDFNDFVKSQAALGFGSKISSKLGIDGLDPTKAAAMQDIIAKNFTFDKKTGKYEIKKGISKEDKQAIIEDLKKLNLGKDSVALDRISEALNNSSDNLKTTNTILNRIYNVLTSIDSKTETKSSDNSVIGTIVRAITK